MANLIPFNRRRGDAPVPYAGPNMYNMLEDFFSDGFFPRTLSRDTFKIDVEEAEDSYTVTAEVPGVAKEEISLTMAEDQRLIISVSREENQTKEEKNYIHRERRSTSMSRSVYLANASRDAVKAKLDGGVLTVSVGKEKAVPDNRVIEIE